MNLRRRKKNSPVIPIVALVDILVIVLLFVVATTTFKDAQQQKRAELNLQLPQSSALGEAPEPSAKKRSTLAITPEKQVFLDGKAVSNESLQLALKELKIAQPELELQLEADQETPLGLLVKIWDDLSAAGYDLDQIPTSLQRPAAASSN